MMTTWYYYAEDGTLLGTVDALWGPSWAQLNPLFPDAQPANGEETRAFSVRHPGWPKHTVHRNRRGEFALLTTVELAVRAPKRQLTLPEGIDKATAALVASSIPVYRNSDKCPKPLCDRKGYFKQMALCCDVHGPFYPG